jgi:hypothetical protein
VASCFFGLGYLHLIVLVVYLLHHPLERPCLFRKHALLHAPKNRDPLSISVLTPVCLVLLAISLFAFSLARMHALSSFAFADMNE